MGNSSLATYINITKTQKNSPRSAAIDTITIHCMAAQWTAKTCCDYFANADRGASCNYAVGYDGSIGLNVDECDRSWCTSSSANDNRAITIEVASDSYAPYAVKDVAYNATIELVADICKRNGIAKLIWSTDKNTRVNHLNGCNMTVHRDYAAKACPGDYLYGRMGDIAAAVNAKLEDNMTGEEIYKALTDYAAKLSVPDWAKDEYRLAIDAGITDGTDGMAFIPRYQAAIMAYRAAKKGTGE
ncbi:MAG: N-acetylmuramoyl-L-alanine amidase [Bacteroidales bacterium]|nr:N-acetylmuramoyl-L-alanine amidase [Bacteroidales bacterium]